MRIGDLVRYIPEWQPACVGVVIEAEELFGEAYRLYVCWSNGDGPSWDFAKYFEKVSE